MIGLVWVRVAEMCNNVLLRVVDGSCFNFIDVIMVLMLLITEPLHEEVAVLLLVTIIMVVDVQLLVNDDINDDFMTVRLFYRVIPICM